MLFDVVQHHNENVKTLMYWVCAILGDLFENAATLIDFSGLDRDEWFLGRLARECTEEHGRSAQS